MKFFNNLKSGGVANADKIKTYCEKRIQQIEDALPYLEVFQTTGRGIDYNPQTRAKRQIEILNAIIEQLSNTESTEVRTANVRHLANLNTLAPFGRDVLAILEGGEQQLPSELRDIPKFLHEEEARAEAERIQLAMQRKERERELKRLQIAEQQRIKRKQLAAELGLDLEKLAA